ncbi:Hypothetical predicted protein [Xyrichtys novacula]|uniref:Uncharacterized protein n=1 Tax=Xyrichtys novacula TaxID=13765 RepID=A0AAV1GSJ5_XYRNO|nr:Hypothetical predicted protein [Xyrichtys novacula]
MADGCEVCGRGVGWPPCRLPRSGVGSTVSLKDGIVPSLGPRSLSQSKQQLTGREKEREREEERRGEERRDDQRGHNPNPRRCIRTPPFEEVCSRLGVAQADAGQRKAMWFNTSRLKGISADLSPRFKRLIFSLI